MGGFSFERTAPLLPVFPEISRFMMRWLMILAGMSDIYEFFKLITFFTNLMSKSWLIITKLGVWVPIHHLHHQLQIRFNKSFIVLAFSKKSSISSGAQVWKSMQFVIFKPWKLLWNRSIKQINYQKYWNSYCLVRFKYVVDTCLFIQKFPVLLNDNVKIQLARGNLGE